MFLSSRSITITIQSLQILFLGWRLRNKKTFKSFLVVAAALSNKARQEPESKGYLTDLKNMNTTSDAEISDNENARLMAQTNPAHPGSWIAAARLEVVAGNIQVARWLIRKGCEDVWFEACRLVSPDETKALISKGVKLIPHGRLRTWSMMIWVGAGCWGKVWSTFPILLGCGRQSWSLQVRKKRDFCFIGLWMECCPLHVELWLQLAAVESNQNMWMCLLRQERRYCVVYIRLLLSCRGL